jgi:hypothetical protein
MFPGNVCCASTSVPATYLQQLGFGRFSFVPRCRHLASYILAAVIIFATAHASNRLTLAWDPNPDENIAGYKLRYGTASGIYDQAVDVGKASTGTVDGLLVNTTYFFVVTAYNADGLESLPSNEVSYTLEPDDFTPDDEADDDTDAVTYAGLISATDAPGAPVAWTGFLTMRAMRDGVVTGKITISGETYRWESAFDSMGRLAATIDRGRWLAPLRLFVETAADGNRITGTVTTVGSNAAGATIDLQAAASIDDRSLLAPRQGRYTFVLTPENAGSAEPQGYGVGLLTVSSRGIARLSATLPDGTKVSTSGAIDTNGEFLFHAPLYGDAGFLAGKITFQDISNESDAHGAVLWSKPIRLGDARFKSAFAMQLSLRAAKYWHYFNSSPLLPGLLVSGGRATISFSGGNLPNPPIDPNSPASSTPPAPVTIYTRNGVPTLWAYGEPITATFTPSNGLFRGTFTSPIDGRTRPFVGVVFQKGGAGYGRGLFLDWTQSGRVELVPLSE